MKKILVYIVSLSMLLSNNTMIMAAQTAENKNVQEKTTTVSFDSSSLTTKIGSFKSYDFQGIQSDQIENVFFEYIFCCDICDSFCVYIIKCDSRVKRNGCHDRHLTSCIISFDISCWICFCIT